MIRDRKTSRYGTLRKLVKFFGLAQTFFTILLAHLSVVLGIYLLIYVPAHPANRRILQAFGVAVILCGLLMSFLWRFLSKLTTEGLLMLADIADGLSQQKREEIVQNSKRN